MIVALISLAFFSEQCDCAFFSWIDFFSSGLMMVYLITNSFSLSLQVWNATYFSHCVKFRALYFWLTLMNWFCSCCFCVSFLWWPQTFEMWFCCFPVRIQNAKCCKAIWAPMMKFMVAQFWAFLVRSMSLSVENFPVVHIWACGLIMPDQSKIFLTVFHWRSVKTTFVVSRQ